MLLAYQYNGRSYLLYKYRNACCVCALIYRTMTLCTTNGNAKQAALKIWRAAKEEGTFVALDLGTSIYYR